MAISLPKAPIKAEVVSPRTLLLYGLPKCGKTKKIAELPNALILDFEGGAEMHECMRVQVRSTKDVEDVMAAIAAEAKIRHSEGKTGKELYPYKYLVIDTIDVLEDCSEVTATANYNKKVKPENKQPNSVLEVGNGFGYRYLREEVMLRVRQLERMCERLIIICHTRDKVTATKDGSDVTMKDLSLTGKLGSIVCSAMDAVGYVYRKQNGEFWVSFKNFEANPTMGVRFDYLAGQEFEFDWNRIYVNGL